MLRPLQLSVQVSRWSPLQLGALCLAWWTADDLAPGSVASWKDRVLKYDAAQAVSGSQPVASLLSFGGLPGVTFDGTDDELTLASCPFPTGASPSEIHALVDQSALVADTTSRQAFGYGGTSNATRRALLRRVSGGVNRYGADTGDNASAIATNDASVDFSGKRYVRAIFGAAATTVSIDLSTPVTGAVVPVTGSTRARFGASTANTAANFWNGVIRHVVVTSPLGADDAERMRRWMLNQVGVAR
jgi:hypothetical protein